MPDPRPARPTAFVLIHGAWHGGWCYARVVAELARLGYPAIAPDLAGHGLHAALPARWPACATDLAATAAAAPRAAGVTLEDYADSVLEAVEAAHGLAERVVLVGHSMGGIAVTAAAEKAPDAIDTLVYLAAFMPPSGVPAITFITAAQNRGEKVGPHLVCDPQATGVLRLNTASVEPGYRAGLKSAFFGDCADADVAAALHLLTPDVPAGAFATPIPTTAANWGRLPRHYIKCLCDQAIMPPLQQHFIDEADRANPGNRTHVHTLPTSHSPFLSAPGELARLLADIAAG